MPLGLINLRAALGADAQPDPIRPRTLIALRWVALAGQLAAVAGGLAMGAHFALDLIEGAVLEDLQALAVPMLVTSSHAGDFLHRLLLLQI